MTTNNTNSAWTPILTALIISVVDPNNKFSNIGNTAMSISSNIDLYQFEFGALATAERNDTKMAVIINESGSQWMWADFFIEVHQRNFRDFNYGQIIDIQCMDDEKEKQIQIGHYAHFIGHLSISKFGALLRNEKWTEDCLNAVIQVCVDDDVRNNLKQRIEDTKMYRHLHSIMREYQPSATPGNDSNFEGTAALMKEKSVESCMS